MNDHFRVRARTAAMTMTGRIVTAMSRLTRAAGVPGFTAEDMLREMCDTAILTLGVQGAGVNLAVGGGLRSVSAHPAAVVELERLQEAVDQGPGYESLGRAAAVIVEDVPGSGLWPGLMDGLLWAGMASVVALPLMARGHVWGVLDLYRAAGPRWSEDELAVARAFAEAGASYLALAAERDDAERRYRQVEHQATHDMLTGLPGRGLLLDRLEHAVVAATRHRTAVAVLFVDIDGFKAINDAMGHGFGDVVLVEVGRKLGLAVRSNDTVGRLSGDEFLIICEDLKGSAAQIDRWLHALGRRIQVRLDRPPGDDEVEIMVSVSIGAAVATDARPARQLIGNADRAMYAAKRAGGGQLVISGETVVISLDDYRSDRIGRPAR